MTLKSFIAGLAGLTSCLSIAHATETWHCDQSPLVIENVRLWGEPSTKSLVITNGTIQWIGSEQNLPAAHEHARRYNGDGALVLPGLIDSHTHLDALAAAKHLQRELDIQTEIFPITMRQTLFIGVTTARAHLAGLADMALMQEMSANECMPSPRVILSGPGLLGGAPDTNARLMRGVKSAEDAKAKIEEMAALGASWVALHGITRFTEDELSTIIDVAQKFDLKLMADTDSFGDLAVALEHPIISGEYINRSSAPAYPDAIIDTLQARDSDFFVVPPIGFYTRSYQYAQSDMPPLPDDLFAFVPSEIASIMRTQFKDAFGRDEYIAGAIAAFPTYQEKFDQLRQAGAKIVIGTDNGSLGQFHHDAIWHEMSAWHEMGVTPADVLKGATSTPASMLHLPQLGTLSPGAVADIVLYRGDMASGEFDRNRVETVIKGGVIFVANGAWVGPDTAQMAAEIEAIRTALPE